MSQRRGLGRGLGALIPSTPVAEDEATPDASTREPASADPSSAPSGSTWNETTDPAGSGAAYHATSDGDASEAVGHQQAVRPSPRAQDATDHSATDGASTGEGAAAGTTSPPEAADHLQDVSGARFAELAVAHIRANSRQPREDFDEDEMAELAYSIQQVGLLQPIVVRPGGDGSYELIMGERRWRAAEQAGLAMIPAIVRETSDADMLRDALLENLHRSELNPLEEAAAYQQLLDDFECTHDELSERIGRSRPQISNTLRLLRLTPAVQRRVAAGVLSAGHARALIGVEEAAEQDRLAGRVVSEGLSVRALEEMVAIGGDGATGTSGRRRTNTVTAPRLADLGARLSERYDTRVKVDLGRTKGKITVEFASLEDLERIVELMDPQTDVSPDQ